MIREDKFLKWQQQGLAVIDSYSVNTEKPFIPDKYSNNTELKKLKSKNYSTKEILELVAWGISEEELGRCANITAAVDNLIVQHK